MNVINFSGGRTSAYMTYKLINETTEDYMVCFQNTGREMPETLDFVNECDKRWNLNIVWLEYRSGNSFEVVTYETASRDGRPFSEAIDSNSGILPDGFKRYCTRMLKIDTERRYLRSLGIKDYTIFNGIRYDEPRRWSKTKSLPNYLSIEMPLVKMKTTKQDVLDWWKLQDFDLKINDPYGNCDCCFLKGKGKLAIIAKEKPELFDWWIEKENRLNKTFKTEISYTKLRNDAIAQSGLFDGDPSFECFCNID